MFVMAQIGAWAPASYCQMPGNRRGPMPQSVRVISAVNDESLDAWGGRVLQRLLT